MSVYSRIFLLSLWCSSLWAATLPSPAPKRISYAADIQPILQKYCYECHGAEKQKGGLRLDRHEDALTGGDSGKAMVPGKSAESLLIKNVAGLDPDSIMPPKGEKLSDSQISLLRAWIDQGILWEKTAVAQTHAETHWAFKKPIQVAPPKVKRKSWIKNPIDAFVLARLEKEKIKPSPEADRNTLARRLHFDLLGLPPEPSLVRKFTASKSPTAYEELVDELLASPHYGERWGRHWLDLARYADSDGYEKDSPRPFAYLFRDWVIKALNADLPVDQFTIQQLAGDLLPGAGEEEKIATGFHRNTLTNKEGGVDKEEFRCKAVVDRVNTTATVWLGLTMGCAECHTHKYDPITQREYYQLYAFFNNSDETDLPLPTAEELKTYETDKREWEAKEETLKAELSALAESEEESRKKLKERIAAHAKKKPRYPPRKAAILTRAEKPRKTKIHLRGDFLRKGDTVEPGTPAVLHAFKPQKAGGPTRLDLAKWLVHPENPLTARVWVNRTWGNLFGRALSSSVDDFGKRGELPSHPELLDWLALEFQKNGWSQKKLIRLIVCSATYRQSSKPRPELSEKDPNNLLLARQNRLRLEAEAVRDAALASSGLLSRKIGGPSIRPPLPADIAAVAYANSVKWKESEGEDRNRRGLYIFFQRTIPYPMLMTFDAPDSNNSCTRRERSNTPLQALTLLNDPVFFECAQNLGASMASRGANTIGKIEWGFERCLGRKPTRAERRKLLQIYYGQEKLLQNNIGSITNLAGDKNASIETANMIALARIMMNLDEFFVRE